MQWQLNILVERQEVSATTFSARAVRRSQRQPAEHRSSSNHPLNTEKDAEHYIARLGQVSARMDEAIAEARALAAKNMVPPRFIMRATIVQMRQFIATPPAKNPFVTAFADRMAAAKAVPDARREELRAQAEKIVAAQVYPAWKRGIALLEPLVGRANDDAGLWRFKGGDDAYKFALRRFTTTNLTAEEIHQIGLKRVAEIEQEMDVILKKLGRTQGTLQERIESAREKPGVSTHRRRTHGPSWRTWSRFSRDARAARGARSSISDPRRPSSRSRIRGSAKRTPRPTTARRRRTDRGPGTFQIPLRPERMTKFGLRTLVYHETVPGHHFQIALEMENPALPRFRRLRAFGGISALSRRLGSVRRAPRGGVRLVQGRSRGPARPARHGAVPRPAPRRRHRHPRQALDAAAGDRLRHRSERSRALRRQSRARRART